MYLNHFNIADNPQCECQDEYETVAHFLLWCQSYERERESLRRSAGVMGMRLGKLLGDPEMVCRTAEFIEKTGRFTF